MIKILTHPLYCLLTALFIVAIAYILNAIFASHSDAVSQPISLFFIGACIYSTIISFHGNYSVTYRILFSLLLVLLCLIIFRTVIFKSYYDEQLHRWEEELKKDEPQT